ncbi:MAG TPA: hypothetical protein PLE78_14310 [Flavobacteriales bacterium]|jgi:hypothetical protein|nr:hypothetical protein [Flavobacteriales bacterium]HQW42359.1 hypothetical protein [Flavobacteriales bacterium]
MFLLRASLLILAIGVALFFALRMRTPRSVFFERLLWLLVVAFGVEVVGLLLREFHFHNVVLYNVYAIIEFVVLLSMVHTLHPDRGRSLLVLGAVGGTGVTYSIVTGGLTDYLIIEGLLTISLVNCVVFLLALLNIARNSSGPLHTVPLFWFFAGVLLYFGGIIPVLGTWKYLGQLDLELSQVTYWIVVLLAIVRYSLTAVACALEGEQNVEPNA